MTKWDMTGKVAVVTGATDGIGRVTAMRLAQMGASVVVVGRTQGKPEAVCAEIKKSVPDALLDPMTADLSSLAQVANLAQAIQERHPAISVLVNNAGAMFTTRTESVDGLEMTFALNHLSYFAMTHHLLDTLRADGAARVVNVSSVAHKRVKLDFDDLQMTQKYNAWVAYGRSKLCNLYFTFALAKRLRSEGITVNALHPGFVATAFANNNEAPVLRGFLDVAKTLGGLSPEKGARTSLYLAAAPDVEGITGEYFTKCQITRPAPHALLADAAERLWSVSKTLTGLG